MKLAVIKGWLVTLFLTTIVCCHGYQAHIYPDTDEVLTSKIRRIRSIQKKMNNMTVAELLSRVSEEDSDSTLTVESTEISVSHEMKDKRDTNGSPVNTNNSNGTGAESRQGFLGAPTAFPHETSNSDPDRIGFLFNLLPILEYPFLPFWGAPPPPFHGKPPYPLRGHNRPPPYKPSLPPPPPPIPFKPSPFPPDHKPPPPDYIPGPLPPFPSDGPHFSSHPPSFPDHQSNDAAHDFEPLHKPFDDGIVHHDSFSSDHGGNHEFHDGFDFDFDPPDFFENSGFPHPQEEIHFGHPSDDDEDDHEDFAHQQHPTEDYEPAVYTGPPKPPKFFSILPKPRPPPPPPKLPFHDINTVVNENIYRDDIPLVEIHNENDKIHDGLLHGGIKGLDQGDIDFIAVHTKPYIDSYNEFDAKK